MPPLYAERGQITGAVVDGPLGFDNAVSKESADIKGIVSDVAGNADIIIVPDIESGNMLYKQMTVMSGMDSAGIVLGAKVPIILTSRSSNKMSRKASSALALLYCRNQGKF
jgi:phosphotransacetylase